MATAQPAYSSVEPAKWPTPSATITTDTSATYTAVGPNTLASRRLSQDCRDTPSASRRCVQDTAPA